MTAEEFIKKYGFKHNAVNLKFLPKNQHARLEHLVDSYDLVQVHGLEQSKEIVKNAPSDDVYYSWTLGSSGVRDKTVHIGTLRKAIADVESCL